MTKLSKTALFNVLFEKDRLTGFIDFDHLMIEPRIFDPCYCALSILAERKDGLTAFGYWLQIVTAIFRGYVAHIALGTEERQAVTAMMIEIELVFIAWFFRTGETHLVPATEKLVFTLDKERARIISAASA